VTATQSKAWRPPDDEAHHHRRFQVPPAHREWVAFRSSGTEPLIRCYIEAKVAKQMKKLETACRKLLA